MAANEATGIEKACCCKIVSKIQGMWCSDASCLKCSLKSLPFFRLCLEEILSFFNSNERVERDGNVYN